ncbi:murein hydrolase activator EnvC [Bacteroides sp. 519]|uniref:murein hydrolase activator EnvC family protein n=1 Tax=Bacteroides sp. 519 TaxID=2302937 RepID=UPI0013D20507|nr:peptidoglycan DD-metalloendopeptidase family protein [Bacteroides sp. 519]NDV57288.1 peptidase M23 [Bacteroides sp. 519]
MKRVISIILICILAISSAHCQTLLKDLEEKRAEILKQIRESEKTLNTTKRDVRGQMNALATITGQIDERKRYILHINNDLDIIDRELKSLERELVKLEDELTISKENYASSVRYMAKNNSIEEKLLFIFSAKTLAQTYRRLRYVQEYATYQRLHGEEVIKKQEEVNQTKTELEATRTEKQALLAEREKENKKLEEQEKMQRTFVTELQKKQKGIQDELQRKRREAKLLNNRIDELIAEEIEKARKEAEAEAKKEAKALGIKSTVTYTMTKADRALSSNFGDNRGRLPMPVTGPYVIVGRYGQYAVAGLKNVKLDNKGIDIQTTAGSEARSVFDGVVSAVFQVPNNNLFNVLIRHGNYISVYCGLSAPSVKKGDRVKARQSLGKIFSDKNDQDRTVLQFQLRKERAQLNPEPWLDRR